MLAFEWSANGFKQLPAQYQWTGSAKTGDGFEPNLSLSVPETDDVVWSSSCAADGKVRTLAYLTAPADLKGGTAPFRFETDRSVRTLLYTAKYAPEGQFDGFEIVQNADDPMFAEMLNATWAYVQIGEGDKATKLRISLARAAAALKTFLPACTASAKRAPEPLPTTVAVRYRCENGQTAEARYLGNDTDTPVVRLTIGGAVYLLPQVVSGSGTRYESTPDTPADKRRVWLSKAQTGVYIIPNARDPDGASHTELTCRES